MTRTSAFATEKKRLPLTLPFTIKLVIILKFAMHVFRIHLQKEKKNDKKKHKYTGMQKEASSSK